MKKALVFFVIFIFLLNMTLVTASDSFSDIENTEYQTAVNMLNSLGIVEGYEDGTFKPDDPITRAEFSALMIKFLALDTVEGGNIENSDFSDLPDDYWALGQIQILMGAGIINGYSDHTFKPDDAVSFEEAVKMIVCALGYDIVAQSKGDYPVGYMILASEKGISSGIKNMVADEPITRGIAAKLLNNSLEVEIMKQVEYGETNKFEIDNERTILSERHKLYKHEGKVTAVKTTRLTNGAASGLSDNEIQIDGVTYETNDPNAQELLGNNVTYYVKDDDNINEKNNIVSIKPKSSNYNITIKADDIETITDKQVFRCTDDVNNNRVKELPVSDNAVVIYNGKYLGRIDTEFVSNNDLMPDSGNVRLLDNDNDGNYDVLFVTSYTTLVVNNVSSFRKTVTDKYTQMYKELDEDSREYDLIIQKDGERVAFDSIMKNDVLDIAESKNIGKKAINVIITSNVVTGTVESKTDDGKVVINGNEYEISKSYPDASMPINIGDEGDFYLDSVGKIAAVSKTEAGNVYGYMIETKLDSSVSGNCSFKILTENGEVQIFTSVNKIRINVAGITSSMTPKQICNYFTAPDGKTIQQLIKYGLDKDGNIREICTPDDRTDETMNSSDKDNTLFRRLPMASLYYYHNTLGEKCKINNDVKIFAVPDSGYTTDKEIFENCTAKLEDWNYYMAEIFDINDLYLAKAIVMQVPVSTEGNVLKGNPRYSNNGVAIFDEASKVINDEGEETNRVYYYQDGKLQHKDTKNTDLYFVADDEWNIKDENGVYRNGVVEYNRITFANDSGMQKSLKRGDVFQFSTNKLGEIDKFRVFFLGDNVGISPFYATCSGTKSTSDAEIMVYKDFYSSYCKLMVKNQGSFILQTQTGNRKFISVETKTVYIVDKELDRVDIGSVDDLVVGDLMYIISKNDGLINTIVLYK